MDYQMNMFKAAPDDEAIKMIKYFEGAALEDDSRGYCVCTSEGKDSRVLGHLFRRAGVKHFYLHNITGIDPPELTYFQRKNFQEYRDQGYLTYDVMYGISMWDLMVKKLIPPLRQARYCCVELKEKRVAEQGNAILSFGVRRFESSRRKTNRREMELVNAKKKDYIIMPFDNAENRKAFEICYQNYEKRLNPVAEWTNEDVWSYSDYWKLEQCVAYQYGLTRLGCIGCPQAGECGRKQEFEIWPEYKRLYLKAFERMIEARRQKGKKVFEWASTAEDWFDWWISDGRSPDEEDEMQYELELEY